MFLVVKLVEVSVLVGKISSINWIDWWVVYVGGSFLDKYVKDF